MSKKAQPSLQASDGFTITKSDSGDITSDAANVNGYKFVYVHVNTTAGIVRVSPVDAPDLTSTYAIDLYIPLGGTDSTMVKKVWSTGTTAVGLIAKVGRGGSF